MHDWNVYVHNNYYIPVAVPGCVDTLSVRVLLPNGPVASKHISALPCVSDTSSSSNSGSNSGSASALRLRPLPLSYVRQNLMRPSHVHSMQKSAWVKRLSL